MKRNELVRELESALSRDVPDAAPVRFFDGAQSWDIQVMIARHETGDTIWIESPAHQDALRDRLAVRDRLARESADDRLARLELGLEKLAQAVAGLAVKTLAALCEVSELPQPVQPTKENCSKCESLLITLRDIRDECNRSDNGWHDRLNRITTLVNDVLAKAEGR